MCFFSRQGDRQTLDGHASATPSTSTFLWRAQTHLQTDPEGDYCFEAVGTTRKDPTNLGRVRGLEIYSWNQIKEKQKFVRACLMPTARSNQGGSTSQIFADFYADLYKTRHDNLARASDHDGSHTVVHTCRTKKRAQQLKKQSMQRWCRNSRRDAEKRGGILWLAYYATHTIRF